jgi:hypothetical protein
VCQAFYCRRKPLISLIPPTGGGGQRYQIVEQKKHNLDDHRGSTSSLLKNSPRVSVLKGHDFSRAAKYRKMNGGFSR